MTPASSPTDSPESESPGPVSLRVANGPLQGPVLNRVVSMMLARAACPLDRLHDAMVLCDAISAHAPAHTRDTHLAFDLSTDNETLELRVTDLRPGGASGLIDDALLPDVGNVIERLSDTRRIAPAEDGESEELVLTLGFA